MRLVSEFLEQRGSSFSKIFLGAFFVLNPASELYPRYEGSALSKVDPLIYFPFEKGDEFFKTPEELDSYFYAHQRSRKLTEVYLKNYKNLMLQASSTFELPFALQSCLVFRESKFVKRAKSHVGAVGIAQFIPETYDFLGKALRAGERAVLKSGKNIDKLMFSALKHRESYVLTGRDKTTSYEYLQDVFKDMYLLWTKYLTAHSLKVIDFRTSHYKKILYTPEYSIGLSALYLYYLKKRVYFELRDVVSEEDLKDPEFYLSVAGAYNQGARRLLKYSRADVKDAELDYSKWVNHLSRIRETKYYIKSINRCMQKGVKKPPVNRVASK